MTAESHSMTHSQNSTSVTRSRAIRGIRTALQCSAILLLLTGSAFAQGTVMPPVQACFLSENGEPYASGTITTYAAGTSTLQSTYSEVTLTTPNSNPLTLNSRGCAVVFLSPSSYRVVLKNSAGTQIFDQDNISALAGFNVSLDVSGVAGEALSAGNVVFLGDGTGGTTAGRWHKADADTAGFSITANQIGVAVAAIASGATGSIRVSGRVTGLSGLAAGSSYYISATAGAVTVTAPANRRFVGMAESSTVLVLATAQYEPATPTLNTLNVIGATTLTTASMTGRFTFPVGTNSPLITGAAGSTFLRMTSTGTVATWDQYIKSSTGAFAIFNGSTDWFTLTTSGLGTFNNTLTAQGVANRAFQTTTDAGVVQWGMQFGGTDQWTWRLVSGTDLTLRDAVNGADFLTVTLGASGGFFYARNLYDATDNTHDIGATAANRFRDLHLGRNAAIGGTLGVTGAATLSSTTAFQGVVSNTSRYNSATLQPGFLVYNSSDDAAVAQNAVIDFDTEVYDEAGNFATDLFTAPIGGRYLLCTAVTQGPDDAQWSPLLKIRTSNRDYYVGYINSLADGSTVTMGGCVIADMDISDQAWVVHESAGANITIVGSATPHQTWFSGRLLP